jgi:hypothetical protein
MHGWMGGESGRLQWERIITNQYNNQRAASSVVLSDHCNLNCTVYLYVFSCISLFLYTIIHLAGHRDAATAFRFFTITV